MPRRGRDLEKLVALLEEILKNTGVVIKSPDEVVGIISCTSREIDVSIRTQDNFLIALECRKWSSDKQGVAWIEQLASKRLDINAQRIIAVSSSDFSEGAKNTAKYFGVETRTLDRLNYEDMKGWMSASVPLTIRDGQYSEVRVYFEGKTDQQASGLLQKFRSENRELEFITETGESLSLKHLWRRMLSKNPQLFERIAANGEPKRLTIRADYSDPRRCQIQTDEGPVRVACIDFQATLWVIRPEMLMTQPFQYTNTEGEPIAQVVKWEGKASDIVKQLIFIGVPKRNAA